MASCAEGVRGGIRELVIGAVLAGLMLRSDARRWDPRMVHPAFVWQRLLSALEAGSLGSRPGLKRCNKRGKCF